MRKNCSGFGFVALLLGIVTIFMLASCKQAKVVEKPIETVPSQTNAEQKTLPAPGPHPEAAVGVPEVSKQNENILLVYRHTGSGYAEAYGFDTYVFRLLTDGSGQITGGIAYQRTIGGEIEAVRYNTSLSADEISLTASSPGEKSWSDTLKLKENRVDVSGAHKMVATLDKALVFSSSDGNYRESYSTDPAQKDLPVEIRKGGSLMEKGAWSYPETGKAVYAQTRPEDAQNAEGFQISLWYQDKGDFRFMTEGPEPINEVYATGFASVLASDHALVNAVLLDLMLGDSRYLRPVYAFGISRRGSGK